MRRKTRLLHKHKVSHMRDQTSHMQKADIIVVCTMQYKNVDPALVFFLVHKFKMTPSSLMKKMEKSHLVLG
jgi:hypothetical protein